MNHVPGTVRISSLVITIVALLLLVSGCATVGGPVAEEKRVALAEKTTGAETYKSGALTVSYEYKRVENKLTMSGSVGFYRGVDSLDVRIFFLDVDGLILGKSLVYSSGYRSLAAKGATRTFRTTVDIPVGAVSFSFDETSRERTSQR